MALITRENAAELQAKSRKVIADKKAAMQAIMNLRMQGTLTVIAPAADVREELEIVEEQISCARDALNDKTPWCPVCERPELQPHHRAQLLKSLDTLLNRKRILLGRPLPGSRKPAPDRPARRQLAPQPQPVVDETTRLSNPDEPNG